MTLGIGDLIDDKYRIVRTIGEGGMGVVYEGENTRIHRRVAIKVLHANMATSDDVVARFEKEAQAAGRIGSKHIVEVLDLGKLSDGARYMVMEFLEGESLGERLKVRNRLAPLELYPIVHQLLDGLTAAHAAGIIHRDLKPDNVFILKGIPGVDFVKLLDFGISKFNQLSSDEGFSMTRTGSVMGSPFYMSPEQAKGSKKVDQRADLYAVGVILYECLSGDVPFKADTFNELLFKIALEPAAPIREVSPDVDPVFAAIVTRAMERDPGLRFQSAQEFQQALGGWAHADPLIRSKVTIPTISGELAASMRRATPGVWSQSTVTNVGESGAKPKSKAGIAIAAVAVLAAAAGVGFWKMRSGGAIAEEAPSAKPTITAAAIAAPPPAPPLVEPVKSSEPVVVAPSATASQSAAPVAAPPPVAHVPRPRTSVKPAPSPTPVATPTPPPAEPASTARGRKLRRDL